GDAEGAFAVGGGGDDHELLAAAARDDGVGAADEAREDAGHALQAGGAGEVAAEVAVGLEAVDVAQEGGDALAGTAQARALAPEAIVERAAVGEAGEGVEAAEALQVLVRARERRLGAVHVASEQVGDDAAQEERTDRAPGVHD